MNTPASSRAPEGHRKAEKSAVKVIPTMDLSLDAVLDLRRKGFEILHTPHAGNSRREDLYLAGQGVPHAVFSRNTIAADEIYHPGVMTVDGQSHALVDDDHREVLTPFARISEAAKAHAPHAANAAQLHLQSLRRAVPEADVHIQEELLFLRGKISGRIHDALVASAQHVSVFPRHLREGKALQLEEARRDPKALEEFLRVVEAIVANVERGQNKEAEGAVLGNEATITALAASALLHQEERGVASGDTGEVYVFSGPDMIRYLPTRTNELDDLYRQFRAALPELPPKLSLHVLPGSAYEWIPAPHERELIQIAEGIVTLEGEMKEVARRLGEKNCPDRDSLIAGRKELSSRQEALARSFAAARAERKQFTQYDALRAGTGLADIRGLQGMQFRRIQKLFCDVQP